MPIIAFVFFLLLAGRSPVQSQPAADGVITVCQSGCAYSDFQKALEAAKPGNRIVLTAGERFIGNFRLPYKGPEGEMIVIESSRASELPPAGFRIQPEHSELLPKLVAGDRGYPVLRANEEEMYVQQVRPGENLIVFDGRHFFAEGEAISFYVEGPPPGGMTAFRKYYAHVVSPTALQISETKGGEPVNILTPFTGKTLRATSMEPGSRYVFRGIEFSVAPGAVHEYDLVRIGSGQESTREGLPTQIDFDHVYIHGLENQNGPRMCMLLNARQFRMADSRLEHCNKEGEEGKGIGSILAPGPMLIQNNYIEGGAINMLMGGDYIRIANLVNGDEGGIEIYGNHFHKPLRLKFTAGPGGAADPAGRCSNGWYLNTETGRWFRCDENNSRWVAGPVCARGEYFRRNDVTQTCAGGACWECSDKGIFAPSQNYRGYGYNVKNLFEIKNGINVYVHGNVFENNWVNSDQSGVAVWVVSQVDQHNANGWVRGENITFVNNVIRNSQQGIRIASEGSTRFGAPNRRVVVRNNLLYDIGATATPSLAANDARPISLAGECVDCEFTNNTVVSGVSGGTAIAIDTNPLTRFRFTNNIGNFNQYGLHADRGLPLSFYLPGSNITNNILVAEKPEISRFAPGNNRVIASSVPLFTDAKAKNFRLLPDSPYSFSCLRNCEYAGDDSRDLGADIDRVEEETSGAVSGVPNWIDQIGLSVTSVEDRKATLTYYMRAETVCSLAVTAATNPRALIADVDPQSGDGRERDNREGNTVDGSQRTFNIGFVAPLQPDNRYYYRLNCGDSHVSGSFQTKPAAQ